MFDAYVIVDWSANSRPKRGKDSIWVATARRTPEHGLSVTSENHGTRNEATRLIAKELRDVVERGHSVLVGFDFPYGFPAGFSAALRRDKNPVNPWRVTWNRLVEAIRDDGANRNNRFEVAAQLNECCGDREGPFWGCPTAAQNGSLKETAPDWRSLTFKRHRHTEAALLTRSKQVQEVWKLYTQGSVGSQTLVGIPRVAALHDAPGLESHSVVWPFETGFMVPRIQAARPLVVHAEIWPGVAELPTEDPRVRDQVQVETLARYFAGLDERDKLRHLFQRPEHLDDVSARECVEEEGWILGA